MFCVTELCCVISVSCPEFVFCKSYACFCSVVVSVCDGGLVDDR